MLEEDNYKIHDIKDLGILLEDPTPTYSRSNKTTVDLAIIDELEQLLGYKISPEQLIKLVSICKKYVKYE